MGGVFGQTFTMIGTRAMFLLSALLFLQLHESCAKIPQQADGMTIVDGYGPPGPNEDDINTNMPDQDTSQPLGILYWYHQFLEGQILYPEYHTLTDDEAVTSGNYRLTNTEHPAVSESSRLTNTEHPLVSESSRLTNTEPPAVSESSRLTNTEHPAVSESSRLINT